MAEVEAPTAFWAAGDEAADAMVAIPNVTPNAKMAAKRKRT